MPCGDGRISLGLAAAGHDVTGIDLSPRFVEVASRTASERHLTARFEVADMRDLSFDAEFDAVVNFGGSFRYFDHEGNAAFVGPVARALRSGGQFLIDTVTPETIFSRFQEQPWRSVGDMLGLIENRFDHSSGGMESDWVVVTHDGRRERRHSSMRLYTFRELADMLESSGFAGVEGFDGGEGGPFRLGAYRLILLAARKTE